MLADSNKATMHLETDGTCNIEVGNCNVHTSEVASTAPNQDVLIPGRLWEVTC